LPEFETDQDVVNALMAEQRGEVSPGQDPPQPEPNEQVADDSPESEEVTEEQPIEDSFTGFDPDSLPDDLKPIYRSLQGDYTRKTQELAERGRTYDTLEEYGGVETAAQAMEWLASLQNPENALQLHSELTQALQAQGYSVGEAEQEAARQVQAAREEEADEFDLEGAHDPRVDQLQQKIEELETYREEEQERNLQLALSAEYDRQEAELLRNNPDWNDEDLENVYSLSFSTGGNLLKAAEIYEGLQSHVLGRYLEQKKQVPGNPVPASGPADTPTSYKRLDDPGLEKALNEFLAQHQAAEQ
jgi:hypothetical protein